MSEPIEITGKALSAEAHKAVSKAAHDFWHDHPGIPYQAKHTITTPTAVVQCSLYRNKRLVVVNQVKEVTPKEPAKTTNTTKQPSTWNQLLAAEEAGIIIRFADTNHLTYHDRQGKEHSFPSFIKMVDFFNEPANSALLQEVTDKLAADE